MCLPTAPLFRGCKSRARSCSPPKYAVGLPRVRHPRLHLFAKSRVIGGYRYLVDTIINEPLLSCVPARNAIVPRVQIPRRILPSACQIPCQGLPRVQHPCLNLFAGVACIRQRRPHGSCAITGMKAQAQSPQRFRGPRADLPFAALAWIFYYSPQRHCFADANPAPGHVPHQKCVHWRINGCGGESTCVVAN